MAAGITDGTDDDRPKVVPEGCVNFAFNGQFADTVFTTEYSVRTAMEAVYTLLDIDRGVPKVFGSCYDVRALFEKQALRKISGTAIEELFERYHLI